MKDSSSDKLRGIIRKSPYTSRNSTVQKYQTTNIEDEHYVPETLTGLQREINKLTEERDILLKENKILKNENEKLREENEQLRIELNKEKESNNFLLKSISDAENREYQFEEVILLMYE